MPVRIRKLIGAFTLIALVVIWSLLAMAVAQFPMVKANGLLETVYYVVAGLGWVLPAMPLIRWMSKGERRRIEDGPVR
jgi:membrane protease YdiL (CAAX protease family)